MDGGSHIFFTRDVEYMKQGAEHSKRQRIKKIWGGEVEEKTRRVGALIRDFAIDVCLPPRVVREWLGFTTEFRALTKALRASFTSHNCKSHLKKVHAPSVPPPQQGIS